MMNRLRSKVSTKYILQINIIILTIFFFTSAFSQTESIEDIAKVIFKDGTVIQGQVVQMNINTITIWTPDDDIIIRKFDDIERLVKNDAFFSGSSVGPAATTEK